MRGPRKFRPARLVPRRCAARARHRNADAGTHEMIETNRRRSHLCAASLVAPAAKKKRSRATRRVPVTVATAEQKDMPVQIRAIGNVQPISTVAVRALVGRPASASGSARATTSAAGRLLFTIDPRPYQADAGAGAGEPGARRSAAAECRGRGHALRRAGEEGLRHAARSTTRSSPAPRPRGRSWRPTARPIENAQLQLAYCEIRSPLDGRTGSLQVHAGNLVKANDTTPLVVINQIAAGLRAVLRSRVAARPTSARAASATCRSPPCRREAAHAVRAEADVRRQRRRPADRHDHAQGDVPERRPRALARPVRERGHDAVQPRQRHRRPGRRPCRTARAGSTFTS